MIITVATIMASDPMADADSDADTEDDDATFPSRRPSYAEEDLYCRVGDCLWASRIPGHVFNTA